MKTTLRWRAALAALLLASTAPAFAQLSIHYDVPGVRIGLNLGGYPALQPIPGYPVYYAPGVNANYFFYDGLYWVFDGSDWYASQWYNGPWGLVDPYDVPLYVLRVPVRYYRHAPAYFHGWRADAAPRWGDHWGRGWEERHRDWDRWDRHAVPQRAPLPTYQREFRGDRYPDARRQAEVHNERYRYQPRDEAVRQHYDAQRSQWQQQRSQSQQQRPQAQQQRPQAQPQRAPVQQQPREERRGPGNSDAGHQQGRGQGRENAPGQQGREGRNPPTIEQKDKAYSGG